MTACTDDDRAVLVHLGDTTGDADGSTTCARPRPTAPASRRLGDRAAADRQHGAERRRRSSTPARRSPARVTLSGTGDRRRLRARLAALRVRAHRHVDLDGRVHRRRPTPYSCAWNTTAVADGVYDLRSLATDNAGNTLASTTVASRRVDNVIPTVTLNDPGSPLRGTLTVSATASDGGGITNVGDRPQAVGGQHLDDDLHRRIVVVLVQLEHDRGRATAPTTCGRRRRTTPAARTTSIVTGRVVDNTGTARQRRDGEQRRHERHPEQQRCVHAHLHGGRSRPPRS